jgi:Ca-activated chloride channel family protein
VPKITIAKKAMTALLKDLPKDTKIGLMTYGHRTEGDCKDVELLTAIGAHDPNRLAARLAPIMPKGKTPLAYSLEQSLPYFSPFKGQNNFIILVSDGIETCGGDPAKAAAKLAEANIGLKVHVVGFDVKGAEQKHLEKIAQEGKGHYFNAQNAQGLKKALTQVITVVTKEPPKPPPPPKAPELYFFDDFKGEQLADHWEIVNPNLDSFILANGVLEVVSSSSQKLSDAKIENLFRLNKPLPPGDWIMTAKMDISFQTGQELIFLGLYESPDRYLIADAMLIDYGHELRIELQKNLKGKIMKFDKKIFRAEFRGPIGEGMKKMPQPILLRLRKDGRDYYGGIRLEKAEKPEWIEVGKLTLMRQKGSLIVGIYQKYRVHGETNVKFDWVKIEKLP